MQSTYDDILYFDNKIKNLLAQVSCIHDQELKIIRKLQGNIFGKITLVGMQRLYLRAVPNTGRGFAELRFPLCITHPISVYRFRGNI